MATPSIHATAVAIDGEALLIFGPSRAGKSRLGVALIARATRARPIVLIGDDRIVLGWRDGRPVARPHPRIAGFIERRGLGIVAVDWAAEAPVGGVVELRDAGRDLPSPLAGEGALRHVPRLTLAPAAADPARVLAWWAARGAAATHLAHSASAADRPCAKD